MGARRLCIRRLEENEDEAMSVKGFALGEEAEECECLIKAQEAAQNNKASAVGLLQISRPTWYEKMKNTG